ncbi:NADH-cytochrome b5 reductase, putative [Trypanosoma equiperdum]|uniref:cytochrome-b5 reductase n=4 Tax=Trypanozoon TaxID=39700 RepID=Q57VB6_TRYB2|nr:NADH-cytochrome B5 reductase, putative [Trypanosoma brucei gambiense DAL972]XP_844821.1 NADH-cytochrome b5 reductase, putative [Trypanosoma brucei brucei TREU927]AAX70442.1 NADH-cytochrome b5 reductase, putative [Trypanosoma brucei]RHW72445.1 NADH-cytochrome b5 reductase [Trypanosoma brucei equiperdum]SCU69051.1 NADH-cytochrome b5 reductase, putative [Trypanosoma equiperdum]AAZ11262.1 NADH-cytochrome b5 reductase, putative [Trypanosoma brucei brucei TREU927]CBH11062.1 NADH-cytochrome B5 re|eukprot:XP_011773349.1 NADH-cytochrome B5 reductase, putative [Trypanosoma brucei gambiense DAL972]
MVRLALSFAASLTAGVFYAARPSNGIAVDCATKQPSSFSPDKFSAFKLISAQYESPDTRRLCFGLETAETPFHMPPGACIIARIKDNSGSEITYPFVPITPNNTKGRFEILVKKRLKDKMSGELFQLRPGEELHVKGPFVKILYKPNMWKSVGMLASGTGIAPMYRMLREILDNPKDNTHVSLVYANEKRGDILLANELSNLQATFNNFNMYLALQEVPHRWLGGIGEINEEMIRAFMPKPGERYTKILVAGPPELIKEIAGEKIFNEGMAPEQGPLKGLLKDMGYAESQVFKY